MALPTDKAHRVVTCSLYVSDFERAYTNKNISILVNDDGVCHTCLQHIGNHPNISPYGSDSDSSSNIFPYDSSDSDSETSTTNYQDNTSNADVYTTLVQLLDTDREWIEDKDNENIRCNICFIKVKNTVTNCGHTTCAGCLLLSCDKSMNCPTCRQDIKHVGPFYLD